MDEINILRYHIHTFSNIFSYDFRSAVEINTVPVVVHNSITKFIRLHDFYLQFNSYGSWNNNITNIILQFAGKDIIIYKCLY